MATMHTAGIAAALFFANTLAQSSGVKLDQVIIAARDLDAAKRVYSWLGFAMNEAGRHPGGTQNSAARLGEGGYLELITLYDPS